MKHSPNLVRWASAIGAFPRILRYVQVLQNTPARFDRLRIVNEALGPHWVFRLADTVGLETIKANRPSWHDFYVEDRDGLHCPLDPGAPETETYLGRQYSDMDLAFYAGMGFDGYRLALETQRIVELGTKRIRFDGRYMLELPASVQKDIDEQSKDRRVDKADYYGAYGSALKTLLNCLAGQHILDHEVERVAAGCLLFLCGGHKGCRQHLTPEEAFEAQLEGLIIFSQVRYLVLGHTTLSDAPTVRAVG